MIERFMRMCRAGAGAVYLGNDRILCRALERYSLLLDANDVGFTPNLVADGFWEPGISVTLKSLLRPGMTAIDIGANVGYYSLLMADVVGESGRVIAIEPNPALGGLLRETMRINGLTTRVIVHDVAVSDVAGSFDFIVPPGRPLNSRLLLDEWRGTVDERYVQKVRIETADELLRECDVVDVIKIDVEGAEHLVFKGLLQTIARNPSLTILVEYNFARHAQAASMLATVVDCGFDVHEVQPDGRVAAIDFATLVDPSCLDDRMLLLRKGASRFRGDAQLIVHPDPFWAEVFALVHDLQIDPTRIVAPKEMRDRLPTTTSFADAPKRDWNDVDCLVIHKGWLDQIDRSWLQGVLERLTPCLANPVFVVLVRDGTLPDEMWVHYAAFLALLPEKFIHRRPDDIPPPPQLTFIGNDRLICRDIRGRKLIFPGTATALAAALLRGEDPVGEIGSLLASIGKSFRRVVDLGAGCGLFARAAREVAASDVQFIEVEPDPVGEACARLTLELGGMFWCARWAAELPVVDSGLFGGGGGDAVDLVHVDLGLASMFMNDATMLRRLEAWHRPAVVVTRGLWTRDSASVSRPVEIALEALKSIGYSVGSGSLARQSDDQRPDREMVVLMPLEARSLGTALHQTAAT